MALLLAACSGVRVSADFDPTTDFSALETFDWLPDAKPPGDGPELDDPLLDARIRRAVESTLSGRGFRGAGTGTPDFWIAYHVGVERKVVREYEEGTLLIDVLRPDSGELLWRGSAQARLREQPSPEDREKRVREVVEKILQQFPPK